MGSWTEKDYLGLATIILAIIVIALIGVIISIT